MNQRTDIVTKQLFNRDELIRIAIQKDGTTTIDSNYKDGGRGIYIHPTSIEKALKHKILENHLKRFKGNINQIIDTLKEEYNG